MAAPQGHLSTGVRWRWTLADEHLNQNSCKKIIRDKPLESKGSCVLIFSPTNPVRYPGELFFVRSVRCLVSISLIRPLFLRSYFVASFVTGSRNWHRSLPLRILPNQCKNCARRTKAVSWFRCTRWEARAVQRRFTVGSTRLKWAEDPFQQSLCCREIRRPVPRWRRRSQSLQG